MSALYDYGRRLVVAESEVEKLRHELSSSKGVCCFLDRVIVLDFSSTKIFIFGADAANKAETERNSAISRIADLEKELLFVKDLNKNLKKELQDLEVAGKHHDEELVALLDPVAQGLSGN